MDVDDDDDQLENDETDDENISEDLDEDNIADDDELQDLSDIDLADIDNEDLSDMEFNDDNSDDGDILDDKLISELNGKLKSTNQQNKNKTKKKGKGIDSNIFVSAEKFAEMLEEQSKTKGKHGSSNVFDSRDGASTKQIDWEIKRNQQLKGSSNRKKRKFTHSFNNKRVKRFKY